jgi:hypothetical protein
MIMPGSVTHLRPRRARLGGEGSSAGAAAAQASNVQTPVTTQVTTAVSPVFNVSSGGGTVNQSGQTYQTATPTASNVMPVSQAPSASGQGGGGGGAPGLSDMLGAGGGVGQEGAPGELGGPGGLTPVGGDYAGDYGSYSDSQQLPTGSAFNQSRGVLSNPKMLIVLALAGVAAWMFLTPSGKKFAGKMQRKTGAKTRKKSGAGKTATRSDGVRYIPSTASKRLPHYG